MSSPALVVEGRARRVRCKLCLESRVLEVETWDDRVEPTFAHDCKGKGPKLSHPVTRDGAPIPFFPIGKRVIVERLPPETMVGGFHIPDKHQELQHYGTVIAAGPTAQGVLDDVGIAIGDTICFGKYAGIFWEWQIPGEGFVSDRTRRVECINVDDIIGSKDLAEKMIDGRLGISLHRPEGGGDPEYRFFEEQGPKEST